MSRVVNRTARRLELEPDEYEALVDLIEGQYGSLPWEAPFAMGRLIRKVRDLR